ncbi:MAG TPA: glycosyltransferase [Planctomycetota bacterium]|nr:glycosyltransferase [Planctomycetota bacterium]
MAEASSRLSVLLATAAGPEDPAADDARSLLRALRRAGFPARGVTLRIRGARGAPGLAGEAGDLRGGALVQITRAPAPWFFLAEGAERNIGRAHFDTDRLPPVWAARCNRMDEVWVPSTFNVETFARSGVDLDRLRVVPTPLDPREFVRSDGARGARNGRRFLFAASTDGTPRCATELLLDMFLREFRAEASVGLLLFARGVAARDLRALRERVERIVGDLADRKGAPRVRVESGTDPRRRREELEAADAFVQVWRGDGLGREVLEAAGLGLPIVATRFGAPLDFLHDRNAFLIDCAVVPVESETVALEPALKGHRWAEPIGFHLAETLRRLYEDRAAAAEAGRRARAEVFASHSLDQIGRRLRAVLGPGRGVAAPYSASTPPSPPSEPPLPATGILSVERIVRVAWEGLFPGPLDSFGLPLASRVVGQGFRVACTSAEYGALGGSPDVRVTGEAASATAFEGAATVAVAGACSLSELVAADEVWTPWPSVRDRLVAKGFPASRVVVLPLPVDEDVFGPHVEPAPVPTTRGLRLLFIGPTDRAGGFDILLAAFAAGFTESDDVALLVAPSDDAAGDAATTRLATLQDTPGAPDVVLLEFVARPPERARLYAACDLLVLPYRDERVAGYAGEAMAAGRAVLVPSDPARPSEFDRLGAFTVPAERRHSPQIDPLAPAWFLEPDAGTLARKLRALAADRAGLRARGLASRRKLLDDRAWPALVSAARERIAALVERVPAQATI